LMLLPSDPDTRNLLPDLPQQHVRRVVAFSALLLLSLPPIRLLDLPPPLLFLPLRFFLRRQRIVAHNLNDKPPPLDPEPDEVIPSLSSASQSTKDGELRAGRDEASSVGRDREFGEGEKSGVAGEEGGEGRKGGERGKAQDGGDGVREAGEQRGGRCAGREVGGGGRGGRGGVEVRGEGEDAGSVRDGEKGAEAVEEG
jgi:hypothetical protein